MQTTKPTYTTLAEIYDAVMKDVDYDIWADFIDEVIQVHHPDPVTILELACGTASLSLSLEKLGCYDITATDKSEAMTQKAIEKARKQQASIALKQIDFLDISLDQSFDIIVSIFDSINYLQNREEILQMFNQVKKVMDANSLFIFDFTTPKNSIQAIDYLDNEEDTTENGYHFFRKSRYDANQQIHYNTFEINKLADDGATILESFTEEHRQRVYTFKQMQDIVDETDFRMVAAYNEFDLDKATNDSLRITMVLRCPDIQS
ncbi:MAG: class I SAM-dependent methyltransferase [Balneolaceae bacterium]|nr:class I SAM-dependent methyltransferase [Balneolaceae bacterium]